MEAMKRTALGVGLGILWAASAWAGTVSPPSGGLKYVPTADEQHPKAMYSDSLTSMNDRCPVRQSTLSLAFVPVYVNGQPIGFCCHSCPSVFVQDPERYLRGLAIEPPDLFHKGKKATVDTSTRYRIGFELYYFSTLDDRARFKKDPLRYCGILTDPITMERFRPTAASPHTTYEQRLYYFESDSTKAVFLKDPGTHKDRRNGTN